MSFAVSFPGAHIDANACYASSVCFLFDPPFSHRRLDSDSRQHLPGVAVAIDRPFPRRSHARGHRHAKQPNLFLVGAVNGGVWKTDDFGRSWVPSVRRAADAVDRRDCGRAVESQDHLRQRAARACSAPTYRSATASIESADAGQTWTHLGLDDAQQIPDLAVDPRDPNRLYAAVMGHPFGPSAQRGIYRSTDGGVHWAQVLFKDENTGGSGIKMDPQNPNVLYASLWKRATGPWEDNNVFNGTRRRIVQIDRRRRRHWRALKQGLPEDLSQIDDCDCAEQARPSLRDRRDHAIRRVQFGGRTRRLSIRRRGENWRRITTDPRPALRIGGGDSADHQGRSIECRRALQRDDRDRSSRSTAVCMEFAARRARWRRLPEPVDQPR